MSVRFKGIGIRIGEKVFAYDRETMTLGVRFELAQLKSPKGWIFTGVTPSEWERFCKDPHAATRLAYWFERGHIVTSLANLSFQAIWDGNETKEVPDDILSSIRAPSAVLMGKQMAA